jgi:F-type H+-transporting ATPase subunit delta
MPGVVVQPPSVMDPTALRLAETYAQALLDLFPSEDQAEQIASQLFKLNEIIASIDQARDLLTSTRIEAENRQEMISRVFGGNVCQALEGFLSVLSARGRMHLLEPIARSFRRQLNRRENRQEVTLLVASALDDDQLGRIEQELSEILQSRLVLTVRVDPLVLGGLVVQIGDQVFDASIAGQIERMKKTLQEQRAQRRQRRSKRRFL